MSRQGISRVHRMPLPSMGGYRDDSDGLSPEFLNALFSLNGHKICRNLTLRCCTLLAATSPLSLYRSLKSLDPQTILNPRREMALDISQIPSKRTLLFSIASTRK